MGITAFSLHPLWGHTSLWYLSYSMFQGTTLCSDTSPYIDDTFRTFPGSLVSKWWSQNSTSGLPLHGPLAQCSPLLPPACGQAHSLSSALSLNGLLCVLLPSHGLNVFQRRVLVTCNVALLNSPCGFNTVSSFLIKKAKLFTQGAARSWDDQVGVRSDWWRCGRIKCHKNCQTASREG